MIANRNDLEVEDHKNEKIRRSSFPTTSDEKIDAQSTAGNLDNIISMF